MRKKHNNQQITTSIIWSWVVLDSFNHKVSTLNTSIHIHNSNYLKYFHLSKYFRSFRRVRDLHTSNITECHMLPKLLRIVIGVSSQFLLTLNPKRATIMKAMGPIGWTDRGVRRAPARRRACPRATTCWRTWIPVTQTQMETAGKLFYVFMFSR